MREVDRAREALQAIDAGCERETWVRVGMAAQAAGLDFEDFDRWSAGGSNYGGERDTRSVWKSFKPGGGISAATLFAMAREAGWSEPINGHARPRQRPQERAKPEPRPKRAPFDFAAVWRDSEAATVDHPYIARKLGLADGLRVYRGPLTIAGQALEGALLVPVYDADGKLQSWQAIPPEGAKRSAPGAPIRGGSFVVGGKVRDVVYVVEGIATAWSAHEATGAPAAACFGAGNVETIAKQIRERHPTTKIIIVADAGKERDAERIARAVGGAWVTMPEGSPANFDLNDLHKRDGLQAVAELLAQTHEAEPADEPKHSPLRLIPATREEVAAARLTPREILPGILFADVRLRASAGGAGKTTMVLYEAATLALARTLYGATPSRPMRTVVITREDSRETMLARLREICREMELTHREQDDVFDRVQVIDLSGENWRLTAIVDDVVIPNTAALAEMLAELEPFAPDWVVLDPAVSFGTGEARTNDAEQGLIEACRIIRNRLNCCVELIHHSGKGNARDGARDQYAFRGGSALADGARMVVIVNALEPDAWRDETGLPLQDGESGAVVTFAKTTFSKRPDDIYIRRRGFRFEQVLPSRQSAEQRRDGHAEQVLQFLRDQARQGRRYSTGLLEDSRDTLGLKRQEVRAAVAMLLATGRVTRATGARNTQWLDPAHGPSLAGTDGETAPGTTDDE